MCRYVPPTFTVWLPHSLVTVVERSTVVSPRSQGSEFTNPTIGLEIPLPMLMAVMPLVNSSMFTPGMPMSAAVVRPLATVTALLRYLLTPARMSATSVLVHVRVQLPATLYVVFVPLPTKPP